MQIYTYIQKKQNKVKYYVRSHDDVQEEGDEMCKLMLIIKRTQLI